LKITSTLKGLGGNKVGRCFKRPGKTLAVCKKLLTFTKICKRVKSRHCERQRAQPEEASCLFGICKYLVTESAICDSSRAVNPAAVFWYAYCLKQK
jgi:hypothetical protein